MKIITIIEIKEMKNSKLLKRINSLQKIIRMTIKIL